MHEAAQLVLGRCIYVKLAPHRSTLRTFTPALSALTLDPITLQLPFCQHALSNCHLVQVTFESALLPAQIHACDVYTSADMVVWKGIQQGHVPCMSGSILHSCY